MAQDEGKHKGGGRTGDGCRRYRSEFEVSGKSDTKEDELDRLPRWLVSTLTVTDRGEVTFDEGTLEHLGVHPGEKIVLALLPGGRAELKAERREASWDALRGYFVGKTNGTKLTIDELNDAIASAGAEAGMAGLKRP